MTQLKENKNSLFSQSLFVLFYLLKLSRQSKNKSPMLVIHFHRRLFLKQCNSRLRKISHRLLPRYDLVGNFQFPKLLNLVLDQRPPRRILNSLGVVFLGFHSIVLV